MKTSNVGQGRAHHEAIIRGWVSSDRAGSTGITIRDDGSAGFQIFDLTVLGGTLTINEDGTAVLTIGGGAGSPGEDWVSSTAGGGSVVVTVPDSGSTETIDLTSATVFDITLTANCTLTFSNPPTDDRAHIWIFILRQDGTGSRTVTWPGTVQWQDTDGTTGGSAPTLYTAATAEDVIIITTLDNGATYGGSQERAGSGGATSLDGLSDVILTTPATADRLRFDGTNWRNSALISRPVTTYDATSGLWVPVVDGDGNAVMAEA